MCKVVGYSLANVCVRVWVFGGLYVLGLAQCLNSSRWYMHAKAIASTFKVVRPGSGKCFSFLWLVHVYNYTAVDLQKQDQLHGEKLPI